MEARCIDVNQPPPVDIEEVFGACRRRRRRSYEWTGVTTTPGRDDVFGRCDVGQQGRLLMDDGNRRGSARCVRVAVEQSAFVAQFAAVEMPVAGDDRGRRRLASASATGHHGNLTRTDCDVDNAAQLEQQRSGGHVPTPCAVAGRAPFSTAGRLGRVLADRGMTPSIPAASPACKAICSKRH